MGLCKCPKKKVTNLFCFEHRVNVCEHCLVANHSKCVVQSYLKWLQDSDYNPCCTLCNERLDNEALGGCIRLLCYDVFHWRCLDAAAQQLPANTAPAGYTCPQCSQAIFPASNVVSPVAEALRKILSQVNWARAGLGLPLIEEKTKTSLPPGVQIGYDSSAVTPSVSTASHAATLANDGAQQNHRNDHSQMNSIHDHDRTDQSTHWHSMSSTEYDTANSIGHSQQSKVPLQHSVGASQQGTGTSQESVGHSHHGVGVTQHTTVHIDEGMYSRAGERSTSYTPGSRIPKVFDGNDSFVANMSHDHDEDKYKRRSAFQWLTNWFRSRAPTNKKKDPNATFKRFVVVLVIGLIGFVTIIIIFSKLGHMATDDDPALNPLANPNIRVGD